MAIPNQPGLNNQPGLKQEAKLTNLSINDIREYSWTRRHQFCEKMGFNTLRHIAAYCAYATRETVYVQGGRLLANKPYGGPLDDDNW